MGFLCLDSADNYLLFSLTTVTPTWRFNHENITYVHEHFCFTPPIDAPQYRNSGLSSLI